MDTSVDSKLVKISGVLEKISYTNTENHYLIGEISYGNPPSYTTIKGTLPNVQCGETLSLTGIWLHHKQYGRQFQVKKYTSEIPASVYGIQKYLGSGLIPGIGKSYAKKIVEVFGNNTLQVISEDSGRLLEVDGIGPKRAREIKAAWDTQQSTREVMLFLQTYGVGVRNCMRLVKRFGSEAKSILMSDPYRAAREIDGIGFKTADQIARNLGFDMESPARLKAGLIHLIKDYEAKGHTQISKEDLVRAATDALSVPEAEVIESTEDLCRSGEFSNVLNDCIQSKRMLALETKIAQRLFEIQRSKSDLAPIIVPKAIDWIQSKSHQRLEEHQIEGIKSALSSKVTILTGGPGTGKTTCLRSLVRILLAKKIRVELIAPTGKAAKRLSESTRLSASTIHRLLKYDPQQNQFVFNAKQQLKAGFFILDESSMLDTRLASALLDALPNGASLLLVGDIDQLPSVGSGNILGDLIGSNKVPVVRLHRIFRQKKTSNIISVARGILDGFPAPPDSRNSIADLDENYDLQFVYAPDPAKCIETLKELITKWIPSRFRSAFTQEDIQVLAPLHKGECGISNLNTVLQEASSKSNSALSIGKTKFKSGDRIIQLRNNYEKQLFNGDTGRIQSVSEESGTMKSVFDGNEHLMEKMDLIDIDLAYAISIHKSQGSEFPIVVIPIMKQHFMMLQRNLLYTAITRGKKKVFIVGDPAAWAMAVNNDTKHIRNTGLKAKLDQLW